jgi:hypothetical protein
MLGYIVHGKRFGSQIALAIREEGEGVGVVQNTETGWRVTTHIEATSGYVKEMGCVSG